jgi:predicted nucleotidyltransferase
LEENEEGKIMVTLDTLRREKKTEIIRLAEMSGCRNVRVFGSVATGENRPDSDVDFLVDLESGRTIFDLAKFLGDLRDLLGTEIDVVESRSIHPYIRDRVLAEAVGL